MASSWNERFPWIERFPRIINASFFYSNKINMNDVQVQMIRIPCEGKLNMLRCHKVRRTWYYYLWHPMWNPTFFFVYGLLYCIVNVEAIKGPTLSPSSKPSCSPSEFPSELPVSSKPTLSPSRAPTTFYNGYFYYQYYSSSSCAGIEVKSHGYATNTCYSGFDMHNSFLGSVVFHCSGMLSTSLIRGKS